MPVEKLAMAGEFFKNYFFITETVQRQLPENVIQDLNKMGHFVKAAKGPYPSINVVLKNGGKLKSNLKIKN